MAKYESQVKQMIAPVENVYRILSNPESLRPMLDAAAENPMIREKIREAGQDESQLEKLREVELTADSIAFPAPMIGKLELHIVDREENRCIKFEAVGSPIDATLWIQVLPTSTGGSKMRLTLKADLNIMMKAMIGSKLEKGVDGLADMLSQLPYHMM